MRRTHAIVAVIALLGGPVAPRAGPDEAPPRFIAWQDPAPFAQPFLQLPFDAPETVAPGAFEIGLRALYSNTIISQRTPTLTVDVAVESAAPMLFARYGLARGLELELVIPGVVYYAGFLPRPIKWVESLFGDVNPLRLGPPPPEARFRVLRPDGSGIDWSGTAGSAGDVWIGAKASILEQSGGWPDIAWRAALKLPTGSVPFGSGNLEQGLGLLVGWTFGSTSIRAVGDVMVPIGQFSAAALPTRRHAALQAGVSQRFTPWLTGMAQISVHTAAIAHVGISQLDGPSTYVLAGLAVEPTRRTSISFALVENIIHASQGADITALFELAWRR